MESSSALPREYCNLTYKLEGRILVTSPFFVTCTVIKTEMRVRRDSSDGPRIKSRLGEIFRARVQTGPGAHPACSTKGTVSFPGVRDWGVVLTIHLLPALRLQMGWTSTSASSLGLHRHVMGWHLS
jgi:hypothetical protein